MIVGNKLLISVLYKLSNLEEKEIDFNIFYCPLQFRPDQSAQKNTSPKSQCSKNCIKFRIENKFF